MALSGKTVYGPVLKTTELSVHAQDHASPERCLKSCTIIFLGDDDFRLTGSNFGSLTSSFDSLIPISLQGTIFRRYEYVFC